MKIIRNNIIPFPGFQAINLFGVLFVRGNSLIGEETLNHERIHYVQMKEMFFILFYLWYVSEYLINLIRYKDAHLAYCNISFEREAYAKNKNTEYLKTRRLFTFLNYLK